MTLPLPASAVVARSVTLKEPRLDDGRLFWLEQRPREKGRTTLMLRDGGGSREVTPGGWDLRTRLHEYGGGAYVVKGDRLVLVNDRDRSLWLWSLNGRHTPRRLHGPVAVAIGDGCVDTRRDRWIGVLESEEGDGLISLDLQRQDQPPRLLRQQADFCGSPALSPDGHWLAWVEWNLPAMPWESSTLWLARFDARGGLTAPRVIGGGPDLSVFQPLWRDDGSLLVAEDGSGHWNLQLLQRDQLARTDPRWRPLFPVAAEFAMPQWLAGMATTAVSSRGLVAACCSDGAWQLGRLEALDGPSPRWYPIPLPFTDLAGLQAEGDRAVCVAAGPLHGTGVLEVDLRSGNWSHEPVAEPCLSSAEISVPSPLWFSGHRDQRTHAWLYPPAGGWGTGVPLLLRSHGGPTAMARCGLDLAIQFWTSRGWAVVDVNYGGSVGFGRAYRQRLDGNWGITDVADCVAAAQVLIERGWLDPRRVAIEGGSAGGFTTLACLCFSNVFRAGACRYGVSDLSALARDTHRFERRYLDGLVGPWPAAEALYRQRSPLFNVEGFSCPLVFFQGLQDRVVPPAQTDAMAAALQARGIPVEVHRYAEEGHGFRNGDVQIDVLQTTEAFFRHHLGLDDRQQAGAAQTATGEGQ
ncbi:MAG: S9 family peptidase [Aphanocapsa feldmannii 288cV]|nr:MAG: S9 family peptidase [Aphanocapsa feldmannii 288cV]